MFRKVSVVSLILLLAVPMMSFAQERPPRPPDKNITYNSFKQRWEDRSGNITLSGPDSQIDMFFGSWKESMPGHTHGSLVERDILTKGDSLDPQTRGY